MATTTTTAKLYGVEVTEIYASGTDRIQELWASTVEALQNFPELNRVPNAAITCMNTWMKESGFEQLHRDGTSRHNTIVTGLGTAPGPVSSSGWTAGSEFRDNYWTANPIANSLKVFGHTEGLKDGLYAHGISACMGAYLVSGTKMFSNLVGDPRYYGAAVNAGIVIDYNSLCTGGRIVDLFPDTKEGRKSSIVAGLIIMSDHFNYWKGRNTSLKNNKGMSAKDILAKLGETCPANAHMSHNQALLLASGSYLGGYGFGLDANGASGYDRAIFCRDNRVWTYKAKANTKTAVNSTPASAAPAKPIGCTG